MVADVPAIVVTTTTQVPPIDVEDVIPTAPDATLGTAGILVSGKSASVLVTRSATEVNVSGGRIISSFSGQNNFGDALLLDANGNLHMDSDDEIAVSADGYTPNSPVEVWLFSTPTKLTSVLSNDRGVIEVRAGIPASVVAGVHRLVVEGTNDNGDLVVIALGITYGDPSGKLFSASRLTTLLLFLAMLFGLFLPRTMRRLRDYKL